MLQDEFNQNLLFTKKIDETLCHKASKISLEEVE